MIGAAIYSIGALTVKKGRDRSMINNVATSSILSSTSKILNFSKKWLLVSLEIKSKRILSMIAY